MAKYTNTEYRRILEDAISQPESPIWQVETEDYIDHIYRVNCGNIGIRVKENHNFVGGDSTLLIVTYAYDTGKGFRQPTTILQKNITTMLLASELAKIIEQITTGEIREAVLEVLEGSGYPEEQEIVI